MDRARLVALALAVGAIAAGGCGSSTKPANQATKPSNAATQPTGDGSAVRSSSPLTRAQLIAKGDAICYRLNARRAATKIQRRQDYERLVPALAGYELSLASEMRRMTPPASMAHDWQQMVEGTRKIGEATARIRNYADASSKRFSEEVEPILYKGVNQLTAAAKHAGFNDCSHFG
jgi:hypothetical protein